MILVLVCLVTVNAEVVTIVPTSTDSVCPHDRAPCYPLSQLYQGSANSVVLASDTTLEFIINMLYQLDSTVLIRDATNINLLCRSTLFLCQLHCAGNGSLVFMNITNLSIRGFILYDCGSEISQSLGHEATKIQTRSYYTFVHGLKAAIFAVNVQNLVADTNVVNGSLGYGILGLNVIGNSSLSNLIVGFSNIRAATEHCISQSLTTSEAVKCQGGSVLFYFGDLPQCPNAIQLHTLSLTGVQIVKGLDPVGGSYGTGGQVISHGSGLGIVMTQEYFDVDVYVRRAQIVSNSALASEGSNLHLRMLGSVLHSTITIRDSNISVGNSACVNGILNRTCDPLSYSYSIAVAFWHGGIAATDTSESKGNKCNISRFRGGERYRRATLSIEHTTISRNIGGGLYLFVQPNTINQDKVKSSRNIVINHSKIEETLCSARPYCSGHAYHGESYTNQLEYSFTIQNTVFDRNVFTHNTLNPTEGIENSFKTIGNFIISAFRNITIVNCAFSRSNFPPLFVFRSRLFFEGTITFDSNRAIFGGAIFITGNSFIFLKPNTRILFHNNTATQKGGAIYISGGNQVNVIHSCPIQVYSPLIFLQLDQSDILMTFVNNTALHSGDVLYGGLIDLCITYAMPTFWYNERITRGGRLFDLITDFSEQPPSDSLISSDASQICFCDENYRPNCGKHNNIITVHQYPGELFQVPLVTVGQRNGTVSAVVFTTGANWSDAHIRSFQQTGRTCTNANYSVASSKREVVLLLSAENSIPLQYSSGSNQSLIPILPNIVHVKLLPCENRTGFMLDNNSEVCDCAQPLRERNMTCDINTKVIMRIPPYWLSNHSHHLLVHDHCPYDYCKPGVVPIIMIEPNISDQCAFDRYGTLCGSCRKGLSAVFGSSRCRKCSDAYVTYIILFIAAGIVLVAILYLFNFTVSAGTINGLIFYANVIKINESALFPPGDVGPLRVFIAWLNLDLGIETCFYNGMNSLAKTWLQFVFPLYLWMILAAIIIACRYSITMVKIFGNHSVEVLATVFLLSYTKLLRTVITVFSTTTLEYPHGQAAVWLYDGNYQFGSGSHLALLLFSAFFFVTIALPYTILIFSVQFLRRHSNLRPLKWVTNLMPIFDAYLGPYKLKHGYWTGLLLVVRVVLVVVFALNILGNPAINLFVVSLVAFLIITLNLSLGGVYKNNILTALETFYVANLFIVSSAMSLISDGNWDQRYAIYPSIMVAMLTFIATTLYQVVNRIKGKRCVSRKRHVGTDYTLISDMGGVSQQENSSDHLANEVGGGLELKQVKPLVTMTVLDGRPLIRHSNTL